MIARIASSEVFVALDNVHFRTKYLQNRTQYVILKGNGKDCQKWINLTTHATNRELFSDVTVSSPEVLDKVITTIEFNYKHTPYFGEIWPILEKII